MRVDEIIREIEKEDFETNFGKLNSYEIWSELKKHVSLTTDMPTHIDFGSDCCGFFMVLRDGSLYCNECNMNINEAIKSLSRDTLDFGRKES